MTDAVCFACVSPCCTVRRQNLKTQIALYRVNPSSPHVYLNVEVRALVDRLPDVNALLQLEHPTLYAPLSIDVRTLLDHLLAHGAETSGVQQARTVAKRTAVTEDGETWFPRKYIVGCISKGFVISTFLFAITLLPLGHSRSCCNGLAGAA